MPTHQRLGTDDREDLQDRWKPAIHLDKESAIVDREPSSTAHLRRCRRFLQLFNADEVLGTHNARRLGLRERFVLKRISFRTRIPDMKTGAVMDGTRQAIGSYKLSGLALRLTCAFASALTALATYSSASAYSFRTISASMPAVARRRHSAACSRNFLFSNILFAWKLVIHLKASSSLSTQG